jgi:hypothetical protein
MRTSILGLTASLALVAACGSDKTVDEAPAPVLGPISASKLASSKMVEQATTSTQTQADQSETATSGSDDASGTSKASANQRRGEVNIRVTPTVNFTNPLSADFNVVLDFNNYVGPNAAAQNGNVQIVVRGGKSKDDHGMVITGDVSETYDGNHKIKQSTEPNIQINKSGNRGVGRVVREIKGVVRRALQDATDPNDTFNFLIDHTDTIVTDLYEANILSSRAINGTVKVTDTTNAAKALITFNNVSRPAPSTCLCPTSGNITVAYTREGNTEATSHAFSSTCGEVVITDVAASAPTSTTVKATASAESTANDASLATASAPTSVSSKVTWAFCTPKE